MRRKRVSTPIGSQTYLEAGAGRPLILLHGLPLDSRVFLPMIGRLKERFWVLAPDLLGFGGSAAPPNGLWTVDRLAQGVGEFIRAKGLRNPAIMAHSMGGYVALSLLRWQPELVGQLILISTQASVDSDLKREERYRFAATLEQGNTSQYIDLQQQYCRSEDRVLNGFLQDVIRFNVSSRLSELLRSLASRESYDDVISNYSKSLMFIAGDLDAPRIEELNRLTRKHPNLEVTVVKGVGHMLPLETPDHCAEIVTNHVLKNGRVGLKSQRPTEIRVRANG